MIISMLKNPNEDFQKVIGLIEEKLKQSEEKYRTLIEGLTQTEIGVDIIDLNHNVIYQNDFLKSRFGEHNGRKCYEHYLERENSCKICPMEKAINTNKVEKETIITPENRIYEITSAPLPDKDGKVDRAAEVIIDITERRQVEADLKREKLFIEEALNAQRDTFFVFEPSSGKAIRWNKAFRVISGYSDEEILAMRAPDSYYDEKSLQRAAEATRIIEEKSTSYVNMDLITKDGNSIPFEYIGSNITDEEGNLKYIVSVGRDITDRKKAEQIIKESEFNLKKAQEMAHIGYWKLNPVTEEVSGSDEFFNIFELTSEEASLNAFAEVVHPDDREYDFYHIQRGMEKGIPWDIEHRLICKNGTEKWIHAIGNPIRDENGKVTSILGTIQDVTERTKAEKKLRESEEKYRSLFENSPVALMDQDFSEMKKYVDHLKATGIKDFKKYFEDNPKEVIKFITKVKLIDVNRKTLEVYKFSTKEHFISRMNKLGEGLENKMTEEIFLDNKSEILALINGDTMYESEISSTTSLGDNMNLYAKTSIVSGFESTWSKVIVSILDITDQKNAEKNLRESEEKYRNLVETSSMGLLEIDNVSKNLKYINPRLLEILEYNEDEFLKFDNFDRFIHPEDLKEILDSSKERKIEFRIFNKSGKVKWLSGDRLHYYDENGNLDTVRLWLQDITEKKELEQTKANLITRFSHEFKTPLLSIMGFTELLMIMYKDKQYEELNFFIGRIVEGARRLKSLIDSFIETSYIDEKLVEINFTQVTISKLVRIILNEMEGIITLRNHEITMNIQEDLVATADKEKIRLIISNLVMNAINFTPKGGKISINSNIKKDFITISVKDNGIGLNKEEKSILFKPFGKIERFGQGWDIVPDGMGMGLYITKELVELHKGTIWAESGGRNKGSTFNVKIPLNLLNNK